MSSHTIPLSNLLNRTRALALDRLPNFTTPQLFGLVYNFGRLGLLDSRDFRLSINDCLQERAKSLDLVTTSHRNSSLSELLNIHQHSPSLHANPCVLATSADRCFVYKPPGFTVDVAQDFPDDFVGPPVPPSTYALGGKSLKTWLISQFPQTPIVGDRYHNHGFLHRLDTQTSGVLMVALNYSSYYTQRIRFSLNEVPKEYTCLVHGLFPAGIVRFTDRLVTDSVNGTSFVSVAAKNCGKGKSAITEAECVQHVGSDYSLLRVKIGTGRTHQIRVHLAHAGFPIVGDGKYGRHKDNCRLFLHASSLDGVECSLSQDLEKSMIGLGVGRY